MSAILVPGFLKWDGTKWVLDSSVGEEVSFAGDLTGNPDSQTVVGIQDRPVDDTAPEINQVFVWDGNTWVPSDLPSGFTAGGDLSGTSTDQTVVGLQTRPVDSTAPNAGQALIWDGSIWAPGDVAASSIRAVSSSQPIPSQASEPGWYVIGAFYLPTALTNATVEVIGGVSDPSLTLTVRLFSLDTVSEVTNSRVTITSIPDIRATSSVIASLPASAVYQVQAEAISAFPGDGVWAMVKSVEITT